MADTLDDAVPLKIGTKVLVKEKGLQGTVRYVGTTLFAPGKWVGVELNEPKGKNNGLVGDKQYFTCAEMHGLFVRQNQLQVLAAEVSRLPLPQSSSGIPRRQSMGQSQGQAPGSAKKSPGLSPPQPTKKGHGEGVSPPPPATPQAVVIPLQAAIPSTTSLPPPPVSVVKQLSNDLESSGEKSDKSDSGDTMADLQQKLDSAQQKSKLDEKARMKEVEKLKVQLQQLLDYKMKWSESQTELQQQLRAAKKELKEAVLAKQKAEEDFKELSDAVEMTTLDKEMAEEKCDSLQLENDALKEKIEELTIDLELIKSEISEGGKEGAACTFQVKQLEQQNTKLKEALVRLRDISTQDKADHQRVVKDLEKHTTEINQLKEAKAKMESEIRTQEALIDELKEQVDAALGAEEMVEKLTDRNLQLEERVNQLTETVSDLEALKELSDQQEELRTETEHDLREELDMSMNSVRQREKDIESAQETIVDQQQTIDKFRELVKQLQVEIQELKERGDLQRELQQRRESDATIATTTQSILNLNAMQLRSSAKTHSRTIEFELRKLEAQQAMEHINHLKAFMPNSFLATGGDYDALLVLMLLSRLAFKSELIIEQLKQQNNVEEALSSLGTAVGSPADQVAFSCLAVYRLMRAHLLVTTTIRVLGECNVQLYRQMGTVRDELAQHEKALDHLIDLLKSEKLDESTQLNSIERAIAHFENLLRTRLDHQLNDHTLNLLNQSRMLSAGCDLMTAEMHRLRAIASGKEQFVTRLKELESFNNDMRQACKKIRRKIPTPESRWVLVYPVSVAQLIDGNVRKQTMIVEALRVMHTSISKRVGTLSEGEYLLTGEVEEFARRAVQPIVQELQLPGGEVHEPLEFLRFVISEVSSSLDKFLVALLDGEYDKEEQKTKVDPPVALRAKAVKDELSDTEGLRFKLEDRHKDILELKKALRVKVQELGESNLKIGILEKKFENVEGECLKRIEAEKAEALKYQAAMEAEKKKYDNAIVILQKEMETLERDNATLQKSLEEQQLKKEAGGGGKRVMAGGGFSTPVASPFASKRAASVDQGETPTGHALAAAPTEDSVLLLGKLDSLTKALNFSEDENLRLRSQIAKAQLESLSPLHIPKRMIVRKDGGGTKGVGSGEESKEDGGSELVSNRTDQEKMVIKQTGLLLKELNRMCSCPRVVDITGSSKDHGKVDSPREAIANQLATVLDISRRKQKVTEEAVRLLASRQQGGTVPTSLTSFVSPQFSKALDEVAHPSLCARLNLAASAEMAGTNRPPHKLILSHQQFQQLHTAIIC